MKKILLAAALIACMGVSSGSQAAGTASAGAARPAGVARVATGAQVPLVASARTPEEWSARRPHFRDLRPKARGTFD